MKSGIPGHGRNDSVSGSIGGLATPGSPLAGPKDSIAGPSGAGKLSRSNSAWGEIGEDERPVEEEIKESDEEKA